jgi:hypothetical protein
MPACRTSPRTNCVTPTLSVLPPTVCGTWVQRRDTSVPYEYPVLRGTAVTFGTMKSFRAERAVSPLDESELWVVLDPGFVMHRRTNALMTDVPDPFRPSQRRHRVIEDANEEQLGKALPDTVIRQLDQHRCWARRGETARSAPRTCRQCTGPSTRSCVTPGGDGVPGGVLASGASRWTAGPAARPATRRRHKGRCRCTGSRLVPDDGAGHGTGP